jgi:hypothetical protein
MVIVYESIVRTQGGCEGDEALGGDKSSPYKQGVTV